MQFNYSKFLCFLSNNIFFKFRQLLAEKGDFAEFLVEYLQNIDEEDEDEFEEIKKTLDDKNGRILLERAISHQSAVSKYVLNLVLLDLSCLRFTNNLESLHLSMAGFFPEIFLVCGP